MADKIFKLRKEIEEEKKKRKLFQKKEPKKEEVDLDKVDAIVKRMQKKYKKEGLVSESVGGRLGELRGIIAESRPSEIKVQTVEDLKQSRSFSVKNIGKIFVSLKSVFTPFSIVLKKFAPLKTLDYYLYSANMRYSGVQFLAISTVIAFLIGLVVMIFSGAGALFFLRVPIQVAFSASIVFAFVSFFVVGLLFLLIPRSRAKSRAASLNLELPFALRHMGTELRAGIGLYKTLQTIAQADYGVLSEEFSRTITEIEEGTDTKDALRNFADRTQSKALRGSLTHIIRALKTGGSLSQIMSDIAEDVSFDLRMKMRDFAEKMNFFGVIFIFLAIVLPVFIAILGSVANAPLGGTGSIFASLPLDVFTITLFYILFMPLILAYMIFYLYIIQPKV